MADRAVPTVLALGLGLAGAGTGVALDLPAGALVGSALLVSAAAAGGVPLAMPTALRDLGFAVIGLSLGAGISPDSFAQLASWGVSLVALTLCVGATMGVAAWILHRAYALDPETALLSASPGTMSYVMAIAADGRGEASVILTLQVLRLLMLAAILPLTVINLAAAPMAAASAASVHAMSWPQLTGVLALVAGLGWLGTRQGMPAAWLVAGMAVNGMAHATGTVQGAAPTWMLFAGFAITGTALGCRVKGLALVTVRRLMGAAVVTVLLATAIAAAFAGITHALTGLSFGQSLIAYAPGGVEAMAAIGLMLGYDPTFIAVHHLARIGLLLLLLPLALRLAR